MALYKVPLTPVAQTFDIYLGGIHYGVDLRWNAEIPAWTIDISDINSGAALINGIPLVTGCNLLEAYDYLGFTGPLVAVVDGSYEIPDYTDLGSSGNLYFVTNLAEFIKEVAAETAVIGEVTPIGP